MVIFNWCEQHTMFFQNERIRLCRSSCMDLLTCDEFWAELCSLMAWRFVWKKKRKLCLVIWLCTLTLEWKLGKGNALNFSTETTPVCHRRDILRRNVQVSVTWVITIWFGIFPYGQQNVGVYSKMLFVSVTVLPSVPLRPTVPRFEVTGLVRRSDIVSWCQT